MVDDSEGIPAFITDVSGRDVWQFHAVVSFDVHVFGIDALSSGTAPLTQSWLLLSRRRNQNM